MEILTKQNLLNDLNFFVLSGQEEFNKSYEGVEGVEVQISVYNDDDIYDHYCHVHLINTVKRENSHVSIAFCEEVTTKYCKI